MLNVLEIMLLSVFCAIYAFAILQSIETITEETLDVCW